MIASAKTFAKAPPVFSFQRTMLITDGAFFNLMDDGYASHPLCVYRHGLRGTQNVNEKEDAKVRDPSNIQQTESAKSDSNAKGVVIEFGLRMIDLSHALFSCAAEDVETTNAVRKSVEDFVVRAKSSKGLEEVANRFARNIANASWTWRNRVISHSIVVDVFHGDSDAPIATFNALQVPCNKFSDYSESEKAVGKVLADGLRGDINANLRICATLDFGVKGSVEVFPSQSYLEDRPKGFARPLYKLPLTSLAKKTKHEENTDGMKIVGQAAFRDQKISNRLRTIDTWFESYGDIGKPIPVEPNGASLEFMQFFRKSNGEKGTAFGMLKRLNAIDTDTPEGMFSIAILMRGGVFGESKKPAKADKAVETETEAG